MRFPCRTLPAAPINMIRPYKEIYEPISRFRVPTDHSFPTDRPIPRGKTRRRRWKKQPGDEDRALTFVNSRVNRSESANFVTMLPFYFECKLILGCSSRMQRACNDTRIRDSMMTETLDQNLKIRDRLGGSKFQDTKCCTLKRDFPNLFIRTC